ncbi:MAG: hypothetical protein ACE5FV_01655 [Woeseia sp.]
MHVEQKCGPGRTIFVDEVEQDAGTEHDYSPLQPVVAFKFD